MKKFVAPLVTLLLAVLLGTSFAQDGKTLVIGTVAEASDLDPRITYDVYSYQRMYAIMEPLLVFDTDLSYKPRLATSWEYAEDGSSITFNLREGVSFHHGRTFTAEDVKYTFDWMLNPDNPAANPALYEDIEEVVILDPYTVRFDLSGDNSFILNSIARLHIVPADLGENEDFGSNPVGTGPFIFDSWSRDDRMVLLANAEYWGGAPKVERVEFRPIIEDATRLIALEVGELDLYYGQPVRSELDALEADDDIVVQRVNGLGHQYVAMNTEHPALGDVRVRQAISHLLPREAIVERILDGVGTVGTGPISPDAAFFNPDAPTYPYDPERAAELLAEAGIENLSLRLHTNENPIRPQMAEVLQFEAAQIGVEIEVIVEEFGAFIDRLLGSTDYDLYLIGWSGNVDPNYAMYELFHSNGGSNFTAYGNPELDVLLDEGRRLAPNSPESIATYKEAQMVLMNDAPFAFINHSEEVALNRAEILNWEAHPYSSATFQDLHLVEKLD